jgi:hypothetical protein
LHSAGAYAQSPFGYRLLQLDERPVKWGQQHLGAGAAITYALITEAMAFNDARNCKNMAPVDQLLERSGVDPAAFDIALGAALSMWQGAANVVFKRSENVETADILIGVDADGRGWAHADVLPDPGPGLVGGIARGLVCLSAERSWKVGFGGNPSAQDLRYTLAHEIGHVIGLNHPSPDGQVMSFNYGEAFAELQRGDIEGVLVLYGPPAPTASEIAGLPVSAP